MSKTESIEKIGEIQEVLYVISGVVLLFFIGVTTGNNILRFTLVEQVGLTSFSLLGAFQLLALWQTKKGKSWGLILMTLLSLVSVPALLLFIPLLSPADSSFGAPMFLVCLLNIINLGLLSQDSITSRLLHRPRTLYNDGPVLVNVLLHLMVGVFLLIFVQYYMAIRGADMTLLGSSLMNAIWTISIFFLFAVILLIVRWRYAWVLFLVLDVLVLTFSLSSLVIAFQLPEQLVLPTAYYGEWAVGSILGVGLLGMAFGIALLIALVYSIPALNTSKKAVVLGKQLQEE